MSYLQAYSTSTVVLPLFKFSQLGTLASLMARMPVGFNLKGIAILSPPKIPKCLTALSMMVSPVVVMWWITSSSSLRGNDNMIALDLKLVTSKIIFAVALLDSASAVVILKSFTISTWTISSATPTELSQILVSQEVAKVGEGGT